MIVCYEWNYDRVECPVCHTTFEPNWYAIVDFTLENPVHKDES